MNHDFELAKMLTDWLDERKGLEGWRSAAHGSEVFGRPVESYEDMLCLNYNLIYTQDESIRGIIDLIMEDVGNAGTSDIISDPYYHRLIAMAHLLDVRLSEEV